MSGQYSPGQRVEVSVTDFTHGVITHGVWKPGTVDTAEQLPRGRTNLIVARDDGGFTAEIIGRRGGNTKIRPVEGVKDSDCG